MGTSPYTRERLAEAAASSRTLSEALGKLGVDPKGPSRPYIRRRMKKLGVDTSHFVRENGARWTREILEPAVAASKSVNDVLRYLGIGIVGGYHTHISRRITAYGIDTSHFVGQKRTEAMRDNRRRRTPSEILVVDASRRVPNTRLKRAMAELGVVKQCSLCGTGPEWLGEPLPLEVDHIDGDWRDNRIENLRLLCPNCHSTTDTYRGRGKRQLP
ncbi:HNH endonuclease signature motif containing protein [Streptomyces sp. NRRL B-1347]|uniref:HNH endonuclease signature motif containing protein n=1 Tax=Streptomyces sp. NRRL B-1347 TaxID=1476877 RepID=UPI0004C9E482|nr:HNH endonuclease signature motif containing protein [Streptomyces sp. NRRL B-1347]